MFDYKKLDLTICLINTENNKIEYSFDNSFCNENIKTLKCEECKKSIINSNATNKPQFLNICPYGYETLIKKISIYNNQYLLCVSGFEIINKDKKNITNFLNLYSKESMLKLFSLIEEKFINDYKFKNINKKLNITTKQFNSIFYNNFEIMFLIDPENGKIIKANKAASTFYGYPIEELEKMSISTINVLSDDLIKEEMQNAKKQKRNYFIFKHKLANGVIRDVEVYSGPIKHENRTILYSIVHDISEKLEAQEFNSKFENELLDFNKLDSISTLTRQIAHDLNNSLYTISGFCDLSLMDLSPNSEIYENIKEITYAVSKASNLVQELSYISKHKKKGKEIINLNIYLPDLVKLLQNSLPANIILDFKIKESLPNVFFEIGSIVKIFTELYSNAIDAIERRNISKGFINISCNYKKNIDSIEIIFQDNGIGIKKKDIKEIFTPFFTTKKHYYNKGLSLAIIKKIIENSEGNIIVESELSKGTKMTITLPIIHNNDVTYEKLINKKIKDLHILFIDDEYIITKLFDKRFKKVGSKIEVFNNPINGFDFYQNNHINIDLVITDYTMPYMQGNTLIKKIRKINKKVPIIICSGDVSRINLNESLLKNIKIIEKPISFSNLINTISNI